MVLKTLDVLGWEQTATIIERFFAVNAQDLE